MSEKFGLIDGKMVWHTIVDRSSIAGILSRGSVCIFKHSGRCPISAQALSDMERAWQADTPLHPCLVHVLDAREVSDYFSKEFEVPHASPQALLIHEGRCIYHASHGSISYADMLRSYAQGGSL